MDFTFVHAADLHLDYPAKDLRSDLPHGFTETVREASTNALDSLVDLCIAENAEFLLLAGDVFDLRAPSLHAQLRLNAALHKLSDAGIRIFRVGGNHDPISGSWASLQDPSLAHLFGADAETHHVEVPGGTVQIRGLSHPDARFVQDPLQYFEPLPHVDGQFRIGLLHCDVDGSAGDGYAPTTARRLLSSGEDYWALGHVHSPHVVSEQYSHIVYPGTTQGRHFGEPGVHGCFVVRVRDGRAHPVFRPLDFLRWYQLGVALSPEILTEGDLLAHVRSAVRDAILDRGDRLAIIRLNIEGRSPLASEYDDLRARGDLLESLRLHLSEEDYLWLDSVSWNVLPDIAAEDRSMTPGLLVDVRRVRDALVSGDVKSTDLARLTQSLGELSERDPRVTRWSDPVSHEDLCELLVEAEAVLQRMVLGEARR